MVNNKKNVFILGAGFSNPVGMPSIREFYNTIKKIYLDKRPSLSNFLTECFQSVVDYRNSLEKVSSKTTIDLDNIETLFSYLDMDNPLQIEVRRNLIYTIINTLNISTDLDNVNTTNSMKSVKTYLGKEDVRYREGNDTNYNLNIYEYFACAIAGIIGTRKYDYKKDDTIITFNYDILLDNIFSFMRIPIDYCYGEENQNTGLKYLKLHGSANWLLCKKCKKITFYDKGYPNMLIKGCKICHDNGVILEPLVVPPTWNKSEHRKEINRVWEVALKEMSLARKIFIIGYSMPPTDMYFEYLMSLGLKDNDIIEKIVIVDRDEDNVKEDDKEKEEVKSHLQNLDEKYRKLLNINFAKYRYEFKSVGVLQFIKHDMANYIGMVEGSTGGRTPELSTF